MQLTAFELALRDADIEHQNLVTVSSILPPGCVELEKDAGVATLHPGEVTFAVMARTETNEPGRQINASIGLARRLGDLRGFQVWTRRGERSRTLGGVRSIEYCPRPSGLERSLHMEATVRASFRRRLPAKVEVLIDRIAKWPAAIARGQARDRLSLL